MRAHSLILMGLCTTKSMRPVDGHGDIASVRKPYFYSVSNESYVKLRIQDETVTAAELRIGTILFASVMSLVGPIN